MTPSSRTNQTLHQTRGDPLRHSYVTHLIEAGYDPLFVQQQVGHSYSSTTALYTSVSADFKHKTVQRMIARRLRTDQHQDGSKA